MKRILAATLVAFCPYVAVAQTAPIQVFASNGVKAALEALKPGVERAAGHPLNIVYGASAGLKRQIAAGEAFDKVAALLGLGFPGGPAVEPGLSPGRQRRLD